MYQLRGTMSLNPDIFIYLNYRVYLEDYITLHFIEKGKSYRAMSKHCGIRSPNYFQQVIAGQKNMTPATGAKVCGALQLPRLAEKYFAQLVALDMAKDPDKKFALLGKLKALAAQAGKNSVSDLSFHSSWLHQIIWSLAYLKDFSTDPHAIQKAIRSSVSIAEIEASLHFLQSKGYLVWDDAAGHLLPRNVQIVTNNDLRNFDLQRNHNRFLQVAQMRLNDSLKEREYQGLTLVASKERWPELKEKMREFVLAINEQMDAGTEGDAVIRLQMAAFIMADFRHQTS